MKLIDKHHTIDPVKYGQLKLIKYIRIELQIKVNRKRIQRLMRIMRLEGEYQKKRTTIPIQNHKKYPYLLRNLPIIHSNQVWCTDITYIPMRKGFMYLSVIMDLLSRYILSWSISNTMESNFCIDTLYDALKIAKPKIFNSDQGSHNR
jgi:putative transposase